MRVTRYLWISNLPQCATEQDIRDLLQSYGKIQNVRIHSDGMPNGAVVAFVDTQSATRAIQNTIRFDKTVLSLQYCESSGNPGTVAHDINTSSESFKGDASSLNHSELKQPDLDRRSLTDREGSNSPTNSVTSRKHACSHKSKSRSTVMNVDSTATVGSRPFSKQRGICIEHLPLRSSDANLREGLFHEYKKHGKISSVVIRGHADERYCIMTFKRSEDAVRALESSKGKVFFGTPITVSLHDGLDVEDPDLCPPEHALDEYHPKATKTLFVGNLCSNTVTQDELRRIFRSYGEILEIDIKIQANQPDTSYAFVQYGDIKSVVRALSNQESIRVGGKSVKLGFGKSQPTNVVWLDNLPTVTEEFLTRQFGRYGHLTHVVLDRKSSKALLYFDTVEMAQRALNETRNRAILGRKVQLDFAGYECQVAFMRRLGKSGSFGKAYDDYRERLKELLSLWPCGLPLFSRHKFFEDIAKDNPGFPFSPSYGHRSSSKRLSSSEHDSPRGRRRSDNKRIVSNLEEDRHRRVERESSNDPSLSPVSDSHSKTKLISNKYRRQSSSSTRCESQHRSGVIDERLVPQSARADNRTRSHRIPDAVSPRTNSVGRATNRSAVKDSHYLDETDVVSSDSLSSDLNDFDTYQSSHAKHQSSHQRISQKSSLSTSFHIASPSPRDHVSSPISAAKPDKKHSHACSSRSSLNSSKFQQRVSNSPEPKCPKKSVHPHIPSNDFPLPLHTRPPVHLGESLSRRPQQVVQDEASDRQSHLLQSADPRLIVRSNAHQSRISRKVSEHKWKLSSLHSPSYPSVPHDTLTKLEQERAKLLRELSLLNNEVGSSRPKVPTSASEQRTSRDQETSVTPLSDGRQADPVKNRVSHDPSPSTTATNNVPGSARKSQEVTQGPDKSDHPGCTKSTTLSYCGLTRSTNDCLSSSSELGDMSPMVAGHLTPSFDVDPIYSSAESQLLHCTGSVSQPSVTPPCKQEQPHVSPRKLSSETCFLTSPVSTTTIDNRALSIKKESCPLSSPNSVASDRNLSTVFPDRDHHMLARLADIQLDIPPPPPPLPENLKTPLWIDTSRVMSSTPTKSLTTTASTNVLTNTVRPSLCPDGVDIISHPLKCSLDERIRLLDAQLLKSEKARPTIDYSKFRIKRKVESTLSSCPPCTASYSENGVIPITSPIGTATDSRAVCTTFEAASHQQIDRSVCSDFGFCVTATSVISVCSPISAVSTSPISLTRPADTSDFVKSMLSSKISPVSDPSLIMPPLDVNSTRAFHVRPTSVFINSSSLSTSDSNTKNDSIVTSAHPSFSNNISRHLNAFDSHHLSYGSLNGAQPIGVATRMPFVPSSPKCSVSDPPASSISTEAPIKPALKKNTVSPNQSDRVSLDVLSGFTDVKPSIPKKSSKVCFIDTPGKSSEHVSAKNWNRRSANDRDGAVVSDMSTNATQKENGVRERSKSGLRQAAKGSFTENAPGPTLDDTMFSNLKGSVGKTYKRRKLSLDSDAFLSPKKLTVKCTPSGHPVNCDSGPQSLKRASTATEANNTMSKPSNKAVSTPKEKKPVTRSLPNIAEAHSGKTESHQLDTRSAIQSGMVGRKKKVRAIAKPAGTSPLNSITNVLPEVGYESMYDKIKRRASKDIKLSEQTKNIGNSHVKRKPKRLISRKQAGSVRSLLGDSDTDECLSDTSGVTDRNEAGRSISGIRKPTFSKPSGLKNRMSTTTEASSFKLSTRVRPGGQKSHRSISNLDAISSDTTNVKQFSVHQTPNASDLHLKKNIRRKRSNRLSPIHTVVAKQSKRRKLSNEKNTSSKQSRTSASIKEKRRRLVRSVFASTDSESLSPLSSDPGTEDVKMDSKSSLRSTSSHRSGSTTHASRSCSPDDLGADAAVRHTFGAFALPSGIVSPRDKKYYAHTPEGSESLQGTTFPVRSPDDQAAFTLKSTPPTLPMMNSSPAIDQSSSAADLYLSNESSDWNIFTSLSNPSTPKRDTDAATKASTPPALDENEALFKKSSNEFEDELPSLEKHDGTESIGGEDDSIILTETSHSHKCENSGHFTDNDLPPPVVSVLADLSPLSATHSTQSLQVGTVQQPDIIEEVVYDTLELQIPASEQGCFTSCSDPSFLFKPESPKASESTPVSATCQDQDSVNNDFPHLPAPGDHTSDVCLPQISSSSISSPVFTPITVLAPNQQSNNFTSVGPPLLVAVPRSGASANLATPGLTILPASFNSAAASASPATSQRHLALLLPAAPVSSFLSVKNPTTSIPNTPAIVYNAPVFSTANSVCVLSSQSPVSSLLIRRGESSSSITEKGCVSSISKSPDLSSTPNSLNLPLEHQGSILQSFQTSLPTATNALGSLDFTSYVQRVIERVKQEKDEEVSQQKDKAKRPKRASLSNTSALSVSSVSSSTFSPSISTYATPSLSVATSLSPSTILTSNVKPYAKNVSVDTYVPITVASKQTDTTVVLKPDPSVIESHDQSYRTDLTAHSADTQMGFQEPPTISDSPEQRDKPEICSTNSVDEVIDAVLNAHFGNSECQEKNSIPDTTPIPSNCVDLSPHVSEVTGSPISRRISETPSEHVEQLSVAHYPPELDSANVSKTQASSGEVSHGEQSAGTSPVGIITPMHMLTLVATNATSISHVHPGPTVVSSEVSNAASISSGVTISPHITSATQSSATEASDVAVFEVPVTKCMPNLETLNALFSATNAPQIEQLAAQFASYPLANYLYSLLAQSRLQPLNSATSAGSSGDALNASSTVSVQSKKPASANSGPSTTRDFFTAVASMAAMTSPSVGQHSSHEPLMSTVLATSSQTFSTQSWGNLPLDVKGFPVAWQGRLSLKNEEIFVQMHYLSGSRDLFKDCMSATHESTSVHVDVKHSTQLLKIVQRMRLEPSQLNGVYRKLNQTSDFCMCLTLATVPPLTHESSTADERSRMNNVLQEVFIKYLVDKCAAGIINVCHPCTQQNLYVIHIFPPCDFSRIQLETTAPVLLANLSKCSTPYLLVVVTTV